jgi:heat shock protein HslJ
MKPAHSITRATPALAAVFTLGLSLPVAAATQNWSVVAVNGQNAVGDAAISFSDDGQFAGNTGCNSFRGSGSFDVGRLTVAGPVITTRMACPGEQAQAQETTILGVLQGDVSVWFDPYSGAMILGNGDDRILLETAAPPDGDDAAGPVAPTVSDADYVNVFGLSGPLNIRAEATTDADIVTRVLPGTMLRNEGCETRPDREWCKIQFLDASATEGWAAAEYLQPAPATVRAAKGLFDNIGRAACTIPGSDATECDFGVARDGTHSAVAVFFRPDGGTQVAHFADGEFAFAELAANDAGGTVVPSLTGDTIALQIGAQRYELPESMIAGNGE